MRVDPPSTQRQVLLLKIIQGFTLRQIGDIMGLPLARVARQINSALAELSRRLKKANVI